MSQDKEYWLKESKNTLDDKYQLAFENEIEGFSKSDYGCMVLGSALHLINLINNYNITVKNVRAILDREEHSGGSYHLVQLLIAKYCDKGLDIVNTMRKEDGEELIKINGGNE